MKYCWVDWQRDSLVALTNLTVGGHMPFCCGMPRTHTHKHTHRDKLPEELIQGKHSETDTLLTPTTLQWHSGDPPH